MKNEPLVELARSEDMAEVLALLQGSFASVQRSERVERGSTFRDWKYHDSPFGKAVVQIVRIDGRVAAVGCLWPMTLVWNDRRFRALQPCDTAVHPAFRRRGLFGQLNRARKVLALERNFDLIFNFPNPNSLHGYIKSGWQHVGRVPWLVRVTKPAAVLRDRLHPGKSKAIEVLGDYHLNESVASQIRVQDFSLPDYVSIERSAGFWKWRFAHHPNRQYGLIRSETDARSLAVFTLSRKPSGLIEMVIVDFCCTPDSLSNLLKSVLQCARRTGAGFIALMKPQSLPTGAFYRRAFVPMREKNLAILPLSPDLPAQVLDIGYWDFRAAMHDSI